MASRVEDVKIPDWKADPDYRKTQDILSSLGIDMLGGRIPDYYSGIGESGGPEFENYLNLALGDIEKGILDTSAATGREGGGVQDLITQAMGEFSTKSRYAEHNRALEGRQWMFGQGRGMTEGVRGAGLTSQGQENVFGLKRAGLDFEKMSYLDEYQAEQDEMKGDWIGELMGMAAGGAAGFMTGGPWGAVAGAMGGVDWGEIFDSAAEKKKLDLGKIGTKD